MFAAKKTKRVIVGLMLVAMISISCACLAGCAGGAKTPNAFVTIDINPSIEIITNDKGVVVSVSALNDDAAVLLVDMSFDSMSIDKAVDLILKEAKSLGYISEGEQNAVLITADAGNKTAQLQKALDARVERFAKQAKLNIDLLAASSETNPKLAERAEALGVTFGKMKLIELAMKYDSTLTEAVAKDMPIKELNAILIKARTLEAELLTQELKNEFNMFKAKLEASEEIEEFRLFNEAIQNATAEQLQSFLGDNMTVEELKAQISQLYNQIKAIDLDNISDAIPEAARTVFELAKSGLESAFTAFDNAKTNLKAAIAEGKSKTEIKLLRKALEALEDAFEDAVERVEDAMGDISIVVTKTSDGVKIELSIDLEDYLEEKIETVKDAVFNSLQIKGVNIEDLEDMLEDQFESAADAFEDKLEQELNEYKSNLKTQIDQVKAQLKAEKEALKAINA